MFNGRAAATTMACVTVAVLSRECLFGDGLCVGEREGRLVCWERKGGHLSEECQMPNANCQKPKAKLGGGQAGIPRSTPV